MSSDGRKLSSINQSINQSYGFVWSAPYVTKSESEVPMDHCQWRGV